MRRRALTALAALLAAMPTVASADVDWRRIDLAAERKGIEQFQSFDQRLQDVGWRLLRGNAEFCERVIPAVGLQVQDVTSYGGPQIARRALGLTGDFAVQTAAAGSPAGKSGVFTPNREIANLGEANPNRWPIDRKERWRRPTRAHDHIDAELARAGALAVTFGNGESVTLEAVPVCAGRFELASRSSTMVATNKRVLLGINSDSFAYPLDVFAAGVAHETAHMLLDHTSWLDRNGRNNRNRRATEREADRMIPWLLANAGYDPRAAPHFFELDRPTSGSILFIRGSHYRWRERAEYVEAEIAAVEALMASEGKADWRVHFRREVDPKAGLED